MLVPAGEQLPPPVATSHTLTVWLHLTERCNLRCLYCYLPEGGRALPLETGRLALERAFATAAARGLKAVKLKYAGGEPTLRFATVLALDDAARKLAASRRLEFERVLLSNGFALTGRMIAELRERGIALMISLDGLGEYQDAQRQAPGGRATSARVLRTLDRLDAAGLVPHISITVSRRNLPGLPALLRFVLERGYPFHINFFRENPYAREEGSLSVPPDELVAGLRAAYRVVEERLPAYPLTGALLDRVRLDLPHDRPCGAGLNYLVVRPDGGITACQMLDQPAGSLFAGAGGTPSGDLLPAVQDHAMLRSLPVYRRGACVDCFWQFACAGGCPLLAFRAAGRWDAPSPYCAVYRELIPSVLRLEGLRMLRSGSFA